MRRAGYAIKRCTVVAINKRLSKINIAQTIDRLNNGVNIGASRQQQRRTGWPHRNEVVYIRHVAMTVMTRPGTVPLDSRGRMADERAI